jgi:D-threo-aldose 1-dehydrogenase
MKASLPQILLPNTTLKLSRVGFGCSMLMGRLTRKESLRLLAAAFDQGITHFDTARLYGYGDAESVLGDFLAGRREELSVATKIGILPPRRSPFLSFAKTVARKAVALNPSWRGALRRKAEGMVERGKFDVPTIRKSLEKSLAELGTDYVDILFLHECNTMDLEHPELLAFLEQAKKSGKVRYFGLATDMHTTESALFGHQAFTSVLQFANSGLNQNILRIPCPMQHGIITHSALGAGFKQKWEQLKSSPTLSRKWSANLNLDCEDRSVLASLFLAYALHANPAGTVLFSSTSEQNIRANSEVVSEQCISEKQIQAFTRLLGSDICTELAV